MLASEYVCFEIIYFSIFSDIKCNFHLTLKQFKSRELIIMMVTLFNGTGIVLVS